MQLGPARVAYLFKLPMSGILDMGDKPGHDKKLLHLINIEPHAAGFAHAAR
jgi:hypothetical protein